jgi:hypothetical protein
MTISDSARITSINQISFLTLGAIDGLSSMIISGNVMITAIAVDDNSVAVTTIGIGLMNSPMIPDAKRSGTNDQIVVIVVDQIGTMVSRHVSNPACTGVNLPDL